jgi:hypothetical protein
MKSQKSAALFLLLFIAGSQARGEKEPQNWQVMLGGERRTLELVTGDQSNDDRIFVEFLPNTPYFAAFDIAYKEWRIAASFKVPGSAPEGATYGKTTASDYIASYYGQFIGADVFYQNYSGFYLRFPNGRIDTSLSDVRSDMQATYVGGNIYLALPTTFGLQAAMGQARLENGFRIGFLLGATANNFAVSASQSIMLRTFELKYPEYAGYRYGNHWNFALSPGLGLTYADTGIFYATLLLMVGGGMSHVEFETASGRQSRWTDNTRANMKLTVGVQGEFKFMGISTMIDYTLTGGLQQNVFIIGAQLYKFELFAGSRF